MSPLPEKIFLAGFMGTGKTAVGQALAERLGFQFIDTDHLIEKSAGKSVSEIFSQEGEKSFRRREAQAVREILKQKNLVVALGGGTICFSGHLDKLQKHGTLILLTAGLREALGRVQREGGRPLLQGPDPEAQARALLAQRQPFYAKVPWQIATDRRTPAKLAEQIHRELPLRAGALRVKLGERSYPIYFQRGGLKNFNHLLKSHSPSEQVVLITNRTLDRSYGRPWAKELSRAFKLKKIILPDGERYKNLKTLQQIYRDLAAFGVDRQTPLIALGGGVIGDLVGYAAASYLRGIPFVQVPTTLLAQVDSSVGGKTGVDLPEGKNLVGAFHQPQFVLIDASFLRTLPRRQLICGMAEVIKYGAIFDNRLFKRLERDMAAFLSKPGEGLEEIIRRCCELKAWVVEEDERETKGLRSLLNFGHTLGHAIEAATHYRRYTHGEAIAMGMAFAAQRSVRRTGLSPYAVRRLGNLLAKTSLPVAFPPVPKRDLFRAMSRDKKRVSGTINFVYLKKIGRAVALPTPLAEIL
jgi:3-dehydroquinate synthase